MNYAEILFNEPPLVISPNLAKIIGLNEAIVLQQLYYWLQKNPKIKDDQAWVYNSITDWQQQFCFFGINTIRRVLDKLIRDGVVIKSEFNKTSFDKISWYSINYEALNAIVENHKSIGKKSTSICPNWVNRNAQTGQIDLPKLGKPIPKTTIDYTKTNKKEKEEKETAPSARGFDGLISEFTQNSELVEALRGFIKMRAANKKPMTDRALKILLGKLDKMGDTNKAKTALLDQSIFRGWQDIYPLKDEKQSSRPQETPKKQSPLEQLDEFLKAENG
jgi:hypothetical protein